MTELKTAQEEIIKLRETLDKITKHAFTITGFPYCENCEKIRGIIRE